MGLARYVVQRLVTYILVLFIGITITFFLPRMMPTNPIDGYISQMQARAGQTLSPAAVQQLRHSLAELYGLQGSLLTQYIHYLNRVVLHFDFGPSFANYPTPASQIIFDALPWTAGLLLTTTLISWVLGNLIGLVAGYYNTILYNSFLPALTLILAGFGWNILSMKTLAVSTKEEGYVTFARLKGTSDWTQMTTYVFRNALLPQVTGLVLSLATIFNGALLTEILFSYPGVGFVMRTAAGSGDYNLLYGGITLSIVAVATAALVLDLIYPLFDPRIRLG